MRKSEPPIHSRVIIQYYNPMLVHLLPNHLPIHGLISITAPVPSLFLANCSEYRRVLCKQTKIVVIKHNCNMKRDSVSSVMQNQFLHCLTVTKRLTLTRRQALGGLLGLDTWPVLGIDGGLTNHLLPLSLSLSLPNHQEKVSLPKKRVRECTTIHHQKRTPRSFAGPVSLF